MYTLPSLRRHVHAIDGLAFELGTKAAYNPYDQRSEGWGADVIEGDTSGFLMASPCDGGTSRWRKVSAGACEADTPMGAAALASIAEPLSGMQPSYGAQPRPGPAAPQTARAGCPADSALGWRRVRLHLGERSLGLQVPGRHGERAAGPVPPSRAGHHAGRISANADNAHPGQLGPRQPRLFPGS